MRLSPYPMACLLFALEVNAAPVRHIEPVNLDCWLPCECFVPVVWFDLDTVGSLDCYYGSQFYMEVMGHTDKIPARAPLQRHCTTCVACASTSCWSAPDPCECFGLGHSADLPTDCPPGHAEATTEYWDPVHGTLTCVQCLPESCWEGIGRSPLNAEGGSSWGRMKAVYR
jgi:hypothetical protein